MTHRYSIGDTVYMLRNGKAGEIVGLSGVAGAESYQVSIQDDPGMSATMPFRYVGERELSVTPVTVNRQPFSTRFGNSDNEMEDQ